MRQFNIVKIMTLSLMIGLFFSSCKDDQSAAGFETLDYYVKVKASVNNVPISNVTFGYKGNSLTPGSDAISLTISPADEELDIQISEEWCHADINRSGANASLKITVDRNTGEGRSAKVYVMAGKGADKSGAIINVTQETSFITPTVSVDKSVAIFDKYGGEETITVTSNLSSWDFQIENIEGESGSTSWVQGVKNGDVLTINASDAGDVDLRKAQIKITATEGDLSATTTIEVTQDKSRKMVAGIELILVEGGTFAMGANSADVGYVATVLTTNSPKHDVTLSDYYIGKFEVTQKQYYDVMGTNPSRYPWANYKGPDNDKYDPARPETAIFANYPVEQITWDMAAEFCNKLNQLYGTQGTFSIPTEAQWEYAARGGKYINESNRLKYAGGDDVALVGNTGNGTGTEATQRPKRVGQYLPNELGIYDMTGNVLEQVYDFFGAYPNGPETDPTGPAQKNTVTGTTGYNLNHVFRGGSYWHAPYTVYQRAGNANADYIGNGLMGFRVVFKRAQ